MRVKICGITRERDAQLAAELGAAAIGLVFWPGSPRRVSRSQARTIAASLPAGVAPVGVFVNQPLLDVLRIADEVGLGGVQLHGEEPLEYTRGILQPVIKAVGVADGFDPRVLDAWPAEITVLLDVHDPVRRGGTGRTIDWAAAAAAASRRPVLLAGGLGPENVAAAVREVHPYGVDVSSGVEASPGIKDERRLRALFAAIESIPHG